MADAQDIKAGARLRAVDGSGTIQVRDLLGDSVVYSWDDDPTQTVVRPLVRFLGWFEPLPDLPKSKREAREQHEASRARDTEPAPAPKTEAQIRKDRPLARGVLFYFPDALMAVAELSRVGNEQHNAGQPMHWAFGKSTDEADCILRHLVDAGTLDTDGMPHSAKVAWRALALLQRELEKADPELHAQRQAARDRAASGK